MGRNDRKKLSTSDHDRASKTDEPLAWIVGDIHGCHAALAALEMKVAKASQRKKRKFVLVSVGDLVDRGPGSNAVIERFRKGANAGTHAAVAGNHEAMMLATLFNERPDLFDKAHIRRPTWVEPLEIFLERSHAFQRMATRNEWCTFVRLMWTSQGGAETLDSYGCDPADSSTWSLPEEHLRYLCNLPLVWQDTTCVVTHALATRTELTMLKMGLPLDHAGLSRVLWSRSIPAEAPDLLRVHISGHTPLRRVQHIKKRNIVRIDQGAFRGNRLAAFCPQLKRTISVPCSVRWNRGH